MWFVFKADIMHTLIGQFQCIIYIYMVYLGKTIKHCVRLK